MVGLTPLCSGVLLFSRWRFWLQPLATSLANALLWLLWLWMIWYGLHQGSGLWPRPSCCCLSCWYTLSSLSRLSFVTPLLCLTRSLQVLCGRGEIIITYCIPNSRLSACCKMFLIAPGYTQSGILLVYVDWLTFSPVLSK